MKIKIKKWLRVFFFIITVLTILISLVVTNKQEISSTVYNFLMNFEYRPIINKDQKFLLENIMEIEDEMIYLNKNCKVNEIEKKNNEKKFNQLKNDIESLNYKTFVINTRYIKKELLFFMQNIYSKKRLCKNKEESILKFNKLTTIEESKKLNWTGINKMVIVENIGKKTNQPNLIVNNNDFFSLNSIMNNIINKTMTDEQKSLAIWGFVRDSKSHFSNPTKYTNRDTIDLINSWGYGNCGYTARTVIDLARLSGFNAREYRLGGHIVAEIFYDEKWHLFDSDGGVIYKLGDGTIASVFDVVSNLDLLKTMNSSVYSIDYLKKAYLNQKNNVVFNYKSNLDDQKIILNLRPKEKIIYMDSNQGRYFSSGDYTEPPSYSNSYFVYDINLDILNLNLKDSRIINFNYPYPIIGGVIIGYGKGDIYFKNGLFWKKIQTVDGEFKLDYSKYFNNGYGVPDEEYQLDFKGDFSNLKVFTQVQVASKSLPLLKEGNNEVKLSDGFKVTFS